MDTWSGRMGEPVTLNKYLYGHSSPVNGSDPSGNAWVSLSEQSASSSIASILRAGSGANYRVFIRKSLKQGTCFAIEQAVGHVVEEVISGIYIFRIVM
jgi:hypothetical protein